MTEPERAPLTAEALAAAVTAAVGDAEHAEALLREAADVLARVTL